MRGLLAAAAVAGLAGAAGFEAEAKDAAGVWFNETLVSGLYRELPVGDPTAIFEHVFAELPSEAVVYPTENYYYFKFAGNGRVYSGNFRLSPDARAENRIHFAYFDTSEPMWFKHLYLGSEDGVVVEETAPLRYDVSYDGKTVTFVLNDLSQEPLESLVLLPHERFVGRSLDESGLRFLLLYDSQTKTFFWVLDEEGMFPLPLAPLYGELLLDARTSYVFFDDAPLDRRVLAGVRYENIAANNYLDGPFDQLPDNYIEETAFADYIAEAYPATRGVLNRRGESPGGETRLAVTPYRQYLSLQDVVTWLEGCRSTAGPHRAAFYACMFYDYQKALYAR